MTTRDIDRRRVLKAGAAFSALGAAAPFAAQLAAAGAASAAGASNYKALVCLYMFGGNDAHNTVLATDSDSWSKYTTARNSGFFPIALEAPGTAPDSAAEPYVPARWGGVLPIVPKTAQVVPTGPTQGSVRTFALHPFLGPLQSLFNQTNSPLAILANVGTLIKPITPAQYAAGSIPVPQSLFSHFDQQQSWQGGTSLPSVVGWGGAMADYVTSQGLNGSGANTIFTAITPSGDAAPGGLSLFLSGQVAQTYSIATGPVPADVIASIQGSSLFGSPGAAAVVRNIITTPAITNNFASDYAKMVTTSINASSAVNSAVQTGVAATVPAAPNYVNPFTGASEANPVALQLQSVATQIACAQQFGLSRQVFFVSVGSFDTHHNQNFIQPDLLGQVAQGLAYFNQALAVIGQSSNVTTFTASDFGRSFTMNGSGTDHGWGGHHFIMGGAVKGGDIYNTYPVIGVSVPGGFQNPNMEGTALIPTVSVDQYGATLGTWFGVPPETMATIFPNLSNFSTANLGFFG